MRAPKEIEKEWQSEAAKLLVGKKIVSVGYLHPDSVEEMGWGRAPIVITLDDGTSIYPSQDDEGNGPGSLFTTSEETPIIPVI